MSQSSEAVVFVSGTPSGFRNRALVQERKGFGAIPALETRRRFSFLREEIGNHRVGPPHYDCSVGEADPRFHPMTIEPNHTAARHLRTIFAEGVAAGLTDRELLERFASRAGEASELAFAALVARHGPMVLHACKAALRDEHDAQDAFQATFLVLVHKARSVWVRDSLGPWLHAVALRVATGARASSALRRSHERRRAKVASPSSDTRDGFDEELRTALHEEVGRLPEGYRKAIVLCDLEGLTHEEAARRLGWPVGTVKSRQARGRDRLRGKLVRRGLAPLSGTVIATLSAERASAAVPASLVDATVRMAALISGGQAAAGLIPATAAVLTRVTIRAMLLARLRLVAGLVLLLGTVAATAGVAIHSGAAVQEPPKARVPVEAKNRSVLDALRPEDIPTEKRLADIPPGTVAVLGDVRGRHAGEVHGLALSPDGKLLASVSEQDKRVRLWDARTLLPVGALEGHRAFVNCVAISPDGRWLASGSGYGDFFLWDMSATPPKGPTLLATRGKDRKFNSTFHAVAFSKDSKTLAVAGDAGGFEMFDMTADPPASRGVLADLGQQAHSLTFSPDGKLLTLAGLGDERVRLYDVSGATPREKASLKEGRAQVISAAFSPDGTTLVALDRAQNIWRWDVSGERPIRRGPLHVRQAKDTDNTTDLRERATIVFSPDGKIVAATAAFGWVRLWGWDGGEPVERAPLQVQGRGFHAGVLAFRTDGKTLITGGDDHVVRAWDLTGATPEERPRTLGQVGGLGGIAFSRDGTKLAIADFEFIRVWDLADARELWRLASPATRLPGGAMVGQALTFSPDGRTIIGGRSLWDVSGHELPRRSITFPLAAGWMHSLSLSADGQALALGADDGKVRVWDMRANEPRERLVLRGEERQGGAPGMPRFNLVWPSVVALSPNGVHLAFSDSEHSIRLWVLAGLEPRERAKLEGTGWPPISSLAFSPDGKVLAAGSGGGTRLWDISGGKPRELHPATKILGVSTARPINESMGFSLAFTPDGKRLIAASEIFDKGGRKPSRPAICVFDVASGQRLHRWDIGVPCWSIALSPDGRHVAAARQDGITLILRLPGPSASHADPARRTTK
jgi:RNA polymerase sigma factor (sigma-70 family)